jgi:hypothetical protein
MLLALDVSFGRFALRVQTGEGFVESFQRGFAGVNGATYQRRR